MANAYEHMMLARNKDRPNFNDYVNLIFTDFIEMHGDRLFGDDAALCGGVARLNGRAVTVIGTVKGHDVKENLERRFGMPNPEGYRKALRLMKQAEKFKRPIICLIDTSGAYCGVGAEERSQGEAIARNLMEMSGLTVPVISVITGEGGSGGALGLAVSNEVYMLENAVYSVISAKGFASILWKDGSREQEAAELMKMTAEDLIKINIIEKVIEEPQGGAHTETALTAANIKSALCEGLNRLDKLSEQELANQRYDKFRAFGEFEE